MSYNIDALTDNCYDGTTCLINKLNIHDEKQLEIIESNITLAKISTLQHDPINGRFDFKHYRAIHKFLFEDIYPFAGLFRNENIAKGNFCFAEWIYIEDELKRILNLTQCGNNACAFIRDTMAALVTEDTIVYKELEEEIFH